VLITGQMCIAAFVAGVAAWVAHRLMRSRRYPTPLPRYFVGVSICLVPWSLAVLAAPTSLEAAIIGAWLVFGGAAVGTWIGYEGDPPALPLPRDLDALAGYLVSEHTDGSDDGDRS